MACAPSNAAVDNLVERLAGLDDDVDFVRIGAPEAHIVKGVVACWTRGCGRRRRACSTRRVTSDGANSSTPRGKVGNDKTSFEGEV